MPLNFNDAVEIHKLIWKGVKLHRIAAMFDENQGRISEINTGKRFPGSAEVASGRRKHPSECKPITLSSLGTLKIKRTKQE